MSDQSIVATTEDGRFRAVLEYDHDCESPVTSGDWWNVSVIHMEGRWSSDMEALHDPESRLDAWRHFNHYGSPSTPDADEAFTRYMSIFHGITVYPVSVGSEGRRGLAWVEPSEWVRVGFDDKIAPFDSHPDALENITASLQEYNSWAEGDCYGYRIQQLVVWDRRDLQVSMETWEDTDDDCWGYVGYDNAATQATEALEYRGPVAA